MQSKKKMYICSVNNNIKNKMSNTTPSSKQKRLSEELQKDGYKLLKQKDASAIMLVKGKTRIKIK